jgi:CheY-like chemotaxis protein
MNRTILVAEDDANDQFFIERELNKLALPLQIRFVSDGEQAIAYLSALGKFADECKFPKPDIMFVDLKMPKLNGFELLEWLRKHQLSQRILTVVVSSSMLQQDIDKAYDLGANAYLVKPATVQDYARVFRVTGEFFLEHAQQPSLRVPIDGATALRPLTEPR